MRHRGIEKTRRIGALLLAVFLTAQTPFSVFAETAAETVSEQTISIKDVHEFLNLVEKCSFDTWSQGKTILLEKDISLEGIEFSPIPIFGGTFDGQGHTISGITIEFKLSQTGLFSILQESGTVRNLQVCGAYTEETNDCVGGIVGENHGVIQNCKFNGMIRGSSNIGGIVGENKAEGTIRECTAEGSIAGKSRTGGIVGNNIGMVSACENMSGINLESEDPGVNLEKIGSDSDTRLLGVSSLDTINVATDTGGIAGFSSGMLMNCVNMGIVGYPQIGYNVGGIAGRNSGYITGCENHSEIFGRKDVGGIVGQAEPYIELKVSEELFQDFQNQLDVLSTMIDQAANETQASSKQVSTSLNSMGDSIGAAADTGKEITDRLIDFGDDAVQEVNRAGNVIADVVAMLDDTLDNAENITNNMSAGFRNLEDALEFSGVNLPVLTKIKTAEAETTAISEELVKMKSGVGAFREYEALDWSAVQENFALIQNALQQIQSSSESLSELIKNISQMIGQVNHVTEEIKHSAKDLQDAMDDFADASDSLTDTLSDLYEITNYLNNTDALQFVTPDDLSEKTAALYDQMKEAGDYADELEKNLSGLTDELTDHIRDINNQLRVAVTSFQEAIDWVEDGEEERVSDTSLEDIEQVVNGKIRGCKNYGAVSGSTAVGGVAGTMSIEYELDPEDDLISDNSLIRRREYELKAILQECINEAAVTARGNYVGSICGEMRLGLAVECEGYGDITSDSGKFVGGIAGHSSGTIQKCYSKCMLSGESIVGGIVGSAGTSKLNEDGGKVTGCYSLAQIVECGEYAGAIAGKDDGEFSGNYFVSKKLAGIDRISSAGKAEPITYEEMMAIPEIPKRFSWFTLRFFAENYMLKSMLFDYGTSFEHDIYPEVPKKDGYYFEWDKKELKELHFDTDVTAGYIPYHWSLASTQRREDGRTTLFVEGKFKNDAVADIVEKDAGSMDAGAVKGNSLFEKREVLEVWKVVVPEDENTERNIRYLPKEECVKKRILSDGRMKRLEIYQNTDSGWQKLNASEMGSYIVAEMSGNRAEIAVVFVTVRWWIAVIAAVLAAAAGTGVVIRRKKRKKRNKNQEDID